MFYFIGGDSRALSSNFFKPLNHICAIFEPYKPAILLFLKLAQKKAVDAFEGVHGFEGSQKTASQSMDRPPPK
jgi:hypothetical protein